MILGTNAHSSRRCCRPKLDRSLINNNRSNLLFQGNCRSTSVAGPRSRSNGCIGGCPPRFSRLGFRYRVSLSNHYFQRRSEARLEVSLPHGSQRDVGTVPHVLYVAVYAGSLAACMVLAYNPSIGLDGNIRGFAQLSSSYYESSTSTPRAQGSWLESLQHESQSVAP